jgi:hypothetical protein
MGKSFGKLEKKEIVHFCNSVSHSSDFKKRINLYLRKSYPSPFPHLLGFDGLPSFEFYAEKVALSSPDENYLLRILKNNIKGEFEAHLLHPEKEKYQYVFIFLDDLKRDYLTDSHGRVNLGQVDLELYQIEASLCSPSAIFDIKPSTNQLPFAFQPCFATPGLENTELQIEFFTDQKTRILKAQALNLPEEVEIKKMALIVDESEILLAVPQKGLAIFELPEKSGVFQINFYE